MPTTDATTLTVKPLSENLGVQITGIDLREPLDPDTRERVLDLMDRYAVAIFPHQSLTQDEQIAVARQFGPADTRLDGIMRKIQTRMKSAEVSDISNVDVSGNVAPISSRQAMMNIGNRLWHTDSSFMDYPWRYSLLYAVTAVNHGGETQWCDLRAAYDALDDRLKGEIEGYVAEHYALQSRMVLGYTDTTPEELEFFPPVRWPLIRTHAGSGRKVLWVSSAIREIIGLSLPEGRQLVQDLLEHATQPPFVHTHKWSPGDLVMWDNRSVLHRGRRFDMATERREMRRVATVDDIPSLAVPDEEKTKVYGNPCV